MSHWRTYLDSDVVRFVDIYERGDITLRIKQVKRGKVTGSGGKANGKCMLYFDGTEKPVAAGTAVLSVIGQLYGNDTREWVGKWVTLFGDPSVKYGGAAVGGVRVRNKVPSAEEVATGEKRIEEAAKKQAGKAAS